MSNILGVSAGFHDASLSVVSQHGDILYAGHSERYSKQKNDRLLHPEIINKANEYGYGTIALYERPWMRNVLQWRSGCCEYGPWTARGYAQKHLGKQTVKKRSVVAYPHHLSHAAAGFQTSDFSEAAVVVIDAIGELDTISIYQASYDSTGHAVYKRLWSQGYPHSIGLFYTAMTQSIGLKPMEDEYILMGMSAYGKNVHWNKMKNHYLDDSFNIQFKENLHIGVREDDFLFYSDEDIAAMTQTVTEILIKNVMYNAKVLTNSKNLVFMGGVALNCVANSQLDMFDNIWVMPNPGDAGSSLGAAALVYKKQLNWQDAFLGSDIPGKYPVSELVAELKENRIAGVANGRAEYGPRALGNRSLLADPRGPEIKDTVNKIKKRQEFRPFAPAILEEHVQDYFDMPDNFPTSDYMQVVARCKYPEQFPAIVHVDGTSRVQTVRPLSGGFRKLLEQWYDETGCPMLLNTSLNIKGEPIVNDRSDADRFEELYKVRVYS